MSQRSCILAWSLVAACFFGGVLPALGQNDQWLVRNIPDTSGNSRDLICREATLEEQAASPLLPIATQPQTVAPCPDQGRVPYSPVPGVNNTVQGGLVVNCNNPCDRLYADPVCISAAFDYFVPRQQAFAPKGMAGLDPAIHGSLPPIRPVNRQTRAASTPVARTTPPAPAPVVATVRPAPIIVEAPQIVTEQTEVTVNVQTDAGLVPGTESSVSVIVGQQDMGLGPQTGILPSPATQVPAAVVAPPAIVLPPVGPVTGPTPILPVVPPLR